MPHEPQEYELHEERASALGTAGAKLEVALMALAMSKDDRDELLDDAADALWAYLTVRESLRLYDHQIAFALYDVPPEVQARAGVLHPH